MAYLCDVPNIGYAPEIHDALLKITEDDTDSKVSVEDWTQERNVAYAATTSTLAITKGFAYEPRRAGPNDIGSSLKFGDAKTLDDLGPTSAEPILNEQN